MLLLTPVQARVVAVLVEKSITTPQYYPMSVNAVMMAANQKNCRFPVMNLTEGETGAALNDLLALRLVQREDGSRVPKWRHRFGHELLIKDDRLAVLVTLMLRGPQTLSELRSHGETLRGPASADGVQAVIDDLQDRAQPLLQALPRLSGQKEGRFVHTLCGEQAIVEVEDKPEKSTSSAERIAALEAKVAVLEARLVELEARLSAV